MDFFSSHETENVQIKPEDLGGSLKNYADKHPRKDGWLPEKLDSMFCVHGGEHKLVIEIYSPLA